MTRNREPSCPPATTLSAWLDDELSDTESKMIRVHLEQCASCREQVAGWVQVVRELRPLTTSESDRDSPFDELRAGSARITTCLDDETLAAYSEAELPFDEAGRAEQHLLSCVRCTNEVQRLVRLRVALAPASAGGALGSLSLWERVRVRAGELRVHVGSFIEALKSPWPALGAIAATVALVLVVGRLLPLGNHVGDVQLRGVQMEQRRVEVITDNTVARARPGNDQAIVVTLGRGTVANGLEESGEWTRIELADGRRVWVHSTNLLRAKEPPP